MEHKVDITGNYYGGLSIKQEEGKFFWSIECYSGDNWEEIPEKLYVTILQESDCEVKNND